MPIDPTPRWIVLLAVWCVLVGCFWVHPGLGLAAFGALTLWRWRF